MRALIFSDLGQFSSERWLTIGLGYSVFAKKILFTNLFSNIVYADTESHSGDVQVK